MDIPKTLEATWKQVTKDGDLTKADYEQLLEAAAPNKLDKEIDAAEKLFLTNLKSELEKKGGVKGRIPVGMVSLADEPAPASKTPIKVKIEDFGEVPQSLKDAWNKVIGDGKVSHEDLQVLAHVASPTWDDNELDENEQKFLGNLKALITSSKDNIVGIITPEPKVVEPPPTSEEPQTVKQPAVGKKENTSKEPKAVEPPPISAEPEPEVRNKVNTTKEPKVVEPPPVSAEPEHVEENGEEQVETKQEAPVNTKPQTKPIPGEDPIKTINGVLGAADQDLSQLSQVKNILDALSDDPDFAPLQKIIEQRIQNSQIAKQYSANVNTLLGSAVSTDIRSLNQVKTALQNEFSKLPENLRNAPVLKKINQDAINVINSAINEWNTQNAGEAPKAQKGKKGNTSVANNGANDIGVPATLKATWKQVTKDGNLTIDDFEKLNIAAAPHKQNKEYDDKEVKFLTNMRAQLEKNGGIISFVDETEAKEQNTSANDGIPSTLKATWNQIAKDGKITIEDFERLNNAAAPTKQNKEYDDEEVQFLASLKQQLEENNGVLAVEPPKANKPKPQASSQVEVSTEGVPETLKAAWKQVGKDGKITIADFERLNKAAAPTKQNSEYDDEEVQFLASLKQQLEENGGVLELAVPEPKSVSSSSGVPDSLSDAWKKVTDDTVLTADEFDSIIKEAAPNDKPEELDQAEKSFLTNIRQKFINNDGSTKESININSAEEPAPVKSAKSPGFGKVPQTLKPFWDKLLEKGEMNNADYNVLVHAAAPNGNDADIDTAEFKFLSGLKNRLVNNNGLISLRQQEEAGPQVSNEPSNNTENKKALRAAFGNQVLGTGDKPVLGAQAARKILAAFGASDISELQRIISTNDDGKFGPNTYAMAKAYVANEIEKANSNVERLNAMLDSLGNDPQVQAMRKALNSPQQPVKEEAPVVQKAPQSEKAQIDLAGIDINNPTAVSDFQKKMNTLIKIYEGSTQKSLIRVPTDGQLTSQFAKSLSDFEKAIGQPAVKAVVETEMGLKEQLGMSKLDNKSAKFVTFQDNDFKIIGDPKDVTRIESAKIILSKVGLNIGAYTLDYPENPAKDGDIKLIGPAGLSISIFDNLRSGRNSNDNGDLQIKGSLNGKNIDVSYWENQRRGQSSVSKDGLFHLRTRIDNQEKNYKSEGILPSPLVRIK